MIEAMMALPGSVQKAPSLQIGFDYSSGALNLAQARQFVSKGFKFCARYISRTPESRQSNANAGTPDLSMGEAQDILNSGMALFAVQHVAKTGWVPSAGLGAAYGQNAASYAAMGGLLEGTNVFLDLEDIPQTTPKQDIIDYANTWFDAVTTGGYEPGIYIGFNVWLSPDELFLKLKFKHYWRAPGNIPDVSYRGYQLIQHEDASGFDTDVTKDDSYGQGIFWHTLNPDLIS